MRSPAFAVKISLLAAFVLLTLYLIAAYSIPAGLSEAAPRFALSLNSRFPAAGLAYAEQVIIEEVDRRRKEDNLKQKEAAPAKRRQGVDLGPIKKVLRGAIANDPINAKAFRLLGQVAVLEHDEKTARQMMETAVKLSLEETPAVDFMMRQSFLANDAKKALYYADVLMRSNTDSLFAVAPLVARMTEAPAARAELIARLGAAPSWRGHVFNSFATSGISDPRAPYEVLSALKDTPNPPTEAETAGYIDLLVKKKLYAFAYSAWLQFLPRSDMDQVAYLFNGSFERKPSALPFDWTIDSSAEISAGVYARPDDPKKSALFIRFGQARGAFPTIRQMVILRPGPYHFKGSLTGEILARRGLQWRITCVGGASAGESQMLVGRFPQWTSFEFDISISQECPAQSVELVHMARTPSEELASGFVWFDDLAITRVAVSTAEP